jgi:hypothetical protein
MNTWLGSNPTALTKGRSAQRAVIAWNRIQESHEEIIFEPSSGSPIASQWIRVESDNRGSPLTDSSGTAPTRNITLFGVRDHPTVADTIIRKGYSFRLPYGKELYIVKDIVFTDGEVQALCEVSR